MPVIGLSHYNLRASRPVLDSLCDFYTTVVGLQAGYRPPFKSFGYWLYAGTNDLLHLSECRSDEHRQPHVRNTFDHVALACSGIESFEKRLVALGIRYTRQSVPLTGQTQLFLSDPAGNGVELNFSAVIPAKAGQRREAR